MARIVFGLVAALTLSAPAGAQDMSAICQGWVGHWRVVDDSSMGEDGAWKPNLSDPLWQVRLTGPSKCRFFKGESTVDFDVDTSQGSYDVVGWEDGKVVPVERSKIVSSAIENPQSWTFITQMPRRSNTSPYYRFAMTMAGDLFSIALLSATSSDGPYFPRSVTVHRRVE